MSEGHSQSVLRCAECNKPFDKQSTLKRHGYYCRSRRIETVPRARSCIFCANRKAHCDKTQPQCSTCVTKGIKCCYPVERSRRKEPENEQSEYTRSKRRKTVSSATSPLDAESGQTAVDNEVNTVSTPLAPDLDFASFGQELLNWDDLEHAFVDFPGPSANVESIEDFPHEPSALVRRTKSPSRDRMIQLQQATPTPSLSTIGPSVTTNRLLFQRALSTGPQRIASLIRHTLRSYPLMMIRDNALPPFIHPQLTSNEFEDTHMEPLTNCISLVHMISSGVRGSRKLFWKNVRLECERLCAEHAQLTKWGLLAAMQALSIYILIRLDEGETDYNNLDFLILATVTVIAKQIVAVDNACKTDPNFCPNAIGWKDWLFMESRRRLAVIYRVVNMLVYFEPAALCDLQRELIIAPLPAKKQLWEAADEFAWQLESAKEPGFPTAYGLAATGDLVKVEQSHFCANDPIIIYEPIGTKTPSAQAGNWEEWCSGMDGFGGLVMLAASLVA